jgi:protein-L-isoaspartate(D-aspartate) O-methyltransferase
VKTARDALIDCLSRDIQDKKVLDAVARVPREEFVPEELRHLAYENIPLSIGFGQTISQPLIVALMTQYLELKGSEKVLEVGTGSGYQAAILAELAGRVVSVERIPELEIGARNTLEKLGYHNIAVHSAGKIIGWPEESPYDAILVTAGAPCIPPVLVKQLVPGGRLVAPVGSRWQQELVKFIRQQDGDRVEKLGGCCFVPLIGEDAWSE